MQSVMPLPQELVDVITGHFTIVEIAKMKASSKYFFKILDASTIKAITELECLYCVYEGKSMMGNPDSCDYFSNLLNILKRRTVYDQKNE